jgi:hypothetical protein
MTPDQFAILQDKVSVWRNSSTTGAVDFRDYNRRTAEALTAALVERAELLVALVALDEVILGRAESNASGNPNWEYVSTRVNAARAAIAKAAPDLARRPGGGALNCRECDDAYPEAGDGWDGLCPSCADRAIASDDG